MNEYSPQSLQDRVAEDVPVLTGLLNDYYQAFEQPLIDQNFDNSTDKSFAYIKALNRMFELDDNSESFEAMYRSFHFAINVAGLAGWNYREAQAMYSYFLTVIHEYGNDTTKIHQRIIEDTDVYMQENKLLGQLVQSYSTELVSNEELRPLCHTVAALTLMQIDQDIIYRSDESEAKRFEQELELWDGVVGDLE
jgi:hypothetical protein